MGAYWLNSCDVRLGAVGLLRNALCWMKYAIIMAERDVRTYEEDGILIVSYVPHTLRCYHWTIMSKGMCRKIHME